MKSQYDERQNEFEEDLLNEIIPFLKELKNTLDRVAEGDKNLILDMMDKFECDLEDQLKQVNSLLSR